MHIVHVHVHVLPEHLDAFIQATIENARQSMQEPGIARFDFIQSQDDPHSFVLVEVYRDENAPARHKETEHYAHWRDAVVEMMAEPRKGIKFVNIYPDESGWG
jgi:quinol monooxygenase YgiN